MGGTNRTAVPSSHSVSLNSDTFIRKKDSKAPRDKVRTNRVDDEALAPISSGPLEPLQPTTKDREKKNRTINDQYLADIGRNCPREIQSTHQIIPEYRISDELPRISLRERFEYIRQYRSGRAQREVDEVIRDGRFHRRLRESQTLQEHRYRKLDDLSPRSIHTRQHYTPHQIDTREVRRAKPHFILLKLHSEPSDDRYRAYPHQSFLLLGIPMHTRFRGRMHRLVRSRMDIRRSVGPNEPRAGSRAAVFGRSRDVIEERVHVGHY